jgi:hypothetical protein
MRGLLERDERKSMEAGRKKRFQSGMNGRHATQLNSSVGELRYVIAEKTWQENNSSSGRNHPPATKNQSWA